MSPQETESGPVYEVSGDIDLFGGDFFIRHDRILIEADGVDHSCGHLLHRELSGTLNPGHVFLKGNIEVIPEQRDPPSAGLKIYVVGSQKY